ncbi:MAG: ABC transporter permease subunit, partial [Rhizobiales bacterium]|nr:ABC transporter permease subunit [Hyphomicrobiales bacterium]
MEWLTSYKIPIGPWAKAGIDWLRAHGGGVFDFIATVLQGVIDGILFALQAPNPLIVIAAIVALAFVLRRSIAFAALIAAGLLFIVNQGYWEETTETLALVVSSALICMAIGLPVGIAAAHRPRLYAGMRPILDLMQTLPSFVYLIPAIIFFGIGMVPGLIATAIFVVPAPIRLTYLGISSAPKHLLEAGEAFGATGRQL